MNYYLLFYYLQISTKQRQMHATVSYMLHAHTTPHSHHLPVDCYFILCIFYVSLHQNESKSDRLKMCSRLHAWRYWLKGMVFVVGSQQYRSKPFRKLTGRDLHSKQLKDDFKVNWKPILTKMEKAPGLTIPSRNNIDNTFIQTMESTREQAYLQWRSCEEGCAEESEKGWEEERRFGCRIRRRIWTSQCRW